MRFSVLDVPRACLIVLLLLVLYPAASWADPERDVVVTNPATDLWRAVRQREAPMSGVTQARNIAAGQLINDAGQNWRNVRRERLIPWGGWVFAGAVAIVALLLLFRRRAPIPGGESGRTVKRFDIGPRVGHWFVAGVMLLLALTGLILLFGRFTLLPWMGSDIFGAIASAAKQGHDLLGPVFAVALLVFFLQLVRKNLPHPRDIVWLAKLGGLFSKHALPAGFFNAGEKMLFWLVAVLGFSLVGSGFLVLFQNLLPDREMMQWVLLIHAITGLGITVLVVGHIYMAVAVKGTMPAMTVGRVDENWAAHHHQIWYQEMKGSQPVDSKPAALDSTSPAVPVSRAAST